MRRTSPRRARGARLCSEAALLCAASCPSHPLTARPSGPCSVAGQMFVGLVRPLLQPRPRSGKPSALTGQQSPASSALCSSRAYFLTLLAPHRVSCLVERVRPALRPHRTVSSSGRKLGHRGTLAPEGSSKHPGCLFIIRRKTLLRRRMTDRWCQRARPCCLRGRRPNDDSVRGVA